MMNSQFSARFGRTVFGGCRRLSRGVSLWALATAAAMAAVGAESDLPNRLDQALKIAVGFEYGADSNAVMQVEQLVMDSAKDPAQRAAAEERLLQALRSPATRDAKEVICRQLFTVGSARSIPQLEALLTDPALAHVARLALGRNEAPEAAAALQRALLKTSGPLQAGILNTLGLRRYEPALPSIKGLLGSPDPVVAQAAAAALGEIGGANAARALQAARRTAPEALRGHVDAALLVCADRFLASGQRAAAARIYEGLYRPEQTEAVQLAALRGMVAARREKALPLLLQAIQSPDAPLCASAIQFSAALRGQAVTRPLAGRLSGLPVNVQELLLAALGARGDPAAVPAVVAALRSENAAVRTAACRALGQLGDSSVVALLARTAATASAPEQPAARTALLELNRGDINTALVRTLGCGDPKVQVELMRALAGRRAAAAFNDLRRFASDPDPTLRHEAIRALGAVADEHTLPALVALTVELKDADDLAAQEQAITAAFGRNPNPEKQTDALLAALGRAPADVKPSLLRLLSLPATPRALTAVRAALRDEQTQVSGAAIRTLAEWPDATPADDLLNVVRTGEGSTLKVIALRGYVRMAGLGTNSGAMYARVLELAGRTEDKKLVLSSLGAAEPGQALPLVEPYLQHEDVRTEAALALVQIAGRLPQSQAARARAVLKSVLAVTSDPGVRQQAQEVIDRLEPYEDHILDWAGAGPFQQKDKDARALFNIAFPPEQPGAAGVTWTRITKGVGSWDINLEEALGHADNAVGYLRARIWSPVKREARMELGSDDAIKVWLNGVVVHAHYVERGLAPRQDLVKVTLEQGWNDLLLKVINASGGWGCACRFRQPDGSTLEDLKVEAR
jgi:HEAT repeat protein